jgi:hypothetical protein
MELSFSEMTGSRASIKKISGNPFRRILFKGLFFDFGKYGINFESASLEYSVLDILSGKKPQTGISETVLSLSKGSLILDGKIISTRISGKIRLRQGRIVLDGIDFILFDQLACRAEGSISTSESPYRVELISQARLTLGRENPIFKNLRMLVTGPLNNLTARGKIERVLARDIHFRMYAIENAGLINIGSRIGIEADSLDINHLLSIDTEVDIEKNTFDAILMPNTGRISAKGSYQEQGTVYAEFNNHQLKVFDYDLSNVIYLNLEPVFRDNYLSHFLVDLNTGASVVNHRPISEIEASFIIDPERIRAVYIKLGNSALLSGFFDIKPRGRMDINLNFTDFILQDFFDIFMKKRPDISGRISGNISIEGPFTGPELKVKLTAYEGHLSDVNYDNMLVNASGAWPHLMIEDSRITHKGSSLMLDGELDMRSFGTRHFMDDITVTASDNTIMWEGWDITRMDESREFLMERALTSGFKIGYKRRMEDETRYEPVKAENELRLEYDFLDDDSALEFRAKENEEFFGIRRRYTF